MNRRRFTDTEVERINDNPYVDNVTAARITYSDEFKEHFVREYMDGKRPTQIFRDAGFDVKLIGYKRIERATARWRPR